MQEQGTGAVTVVGQLVGEPVSTCIVNGALVPIFREPGDGFKRIWIRDATGIRYIPAGSALAACCHRDIVVLFELTESDGILWARRWPPFGMMLSSYRPCAPLGAPRPPGPRPNLPGPPPHPTTPPPPEPIGAVHTLVPAALGWSGDPRGKEREDKVVVWREWGDGWQQLRLEGGSGCFDEPVYTAGCVGQCCLGGALGYSWVVEDHGGVLYAAKRSI